MSPGTRSTFEDELARARLAFISAGQQPLGAPRRAAPPPEGHESPPPEGHESPTPEDTGGNADAPGRSGSGDRLKACTHGRFSLTTRQVVAVLVLLLCGVGVTLLALGRSSASQFPADVSPTVAQSASHSAPTPGPSPTPVTPVRVHVLGAVVSPGVVTVPGGSIVQDAVLAAGGLRQDADPAELNLAATLSDGQQVVVGTVTDPRGEVNHQPGATPGPGSAGGPVNLNTSTAAELEELPGVGPVLASAIVAWREEHGQFSSVAELQEVSGIGPKSFAKLEPLVTT